MTWTAITLSELQTEIQSAEAKMGNSELALWKMVSISPEQWALSPWGDEGGGFWVVAVAGKHCIYYNDIEDGFNVSSFQNWGGIDRYWCNQDQLQWILHRMVSTINGEPGAPPNAGPAASVDNPNAPGGPPSVS
jgi:hypothetical protein